MSDAPYGYCPKCGAKGESRERRPDGDDRCTNGHVYPSRDALLEYFPPLPRPDWRDATPVNWDKRGNRIEALRAAATAVAMIRASGSAPTLHGEGVDDDVAIIETAKQFEKYLEGG